MLDLLSSYVTLFIKNLTLQYKNPMMTSRDVMENNLPTGATLLFKDILERKRTTLENPDTIPTHNNAQSVTFILG